MLATAAQAADRGRSGAVWFVQAEAGTSGKGSRKAPFASLADVERASSPGDRIVVLPSRRTTPPLDGGIGLKPRQQLTGAGPSVRSGRGRRRVPRITNSAARQSGDAVVLADNTTVSNLEVVDARRGGIYGEDVTGVEVRGNDVSGHNVSCAKGFHIPPFNVPTTVPGLGIPISEGLHNGWAGIMVDATAGQGSLVVRNNRVRDSNCGDGIDVRAFQSSRVRAVIENNLVRDLRQGDALESVLAFGLQTADSATLRARLDRNVQTNLGNEEEPGIGPAGADTEGVFVNPTERSRMNVEVSRNTYSNPRGLGGFSANGMEFVSMGDGARASLVIRDSRFSATPGDVLEQLTLGTNAHLSLELDNVVATGSTGFGGSGFGNTVVIPGNNADCLLAASGGAGNRIDLVVEDSELTDCANNGLTFGSAVANGRGSTESLDLAIDRSEITGNGGANVRIGNVAGLDRLSAKIERTDLSDSRGIGSGFANVAVEDLGNTGSAVIDLGGGPLGSGGGNCITGGLVAADVIRYDVAAEDNWWGTPAGPGIGRTVIVGGGLDSSPTLPTRPAHC